MRFFLRPLSFLYGLLARADRSRKLRRARSFTVPIVSVGGITAGGSGKTPVTRELLLRLQEEYAVILLSRGYGRRESAPMTWSPGQPLPDPKLFGDEPALLARSMKRGILGVGPDRAALLESILSSDILPSRLPRIALLDDGFQHAQLNRDLDAVIVDDRTAGERFLLPAGYLREDFSALKRADVLLATSANAERLARTYGARNGAILRLRFRSGEVLHWETSTPVSRSVQRVLLVTAIARPERVRNSAEEKGLKIVAHRTYRDHYDYSERDAREIARAAHDLGAEIVLTTEKDAVKLERYPVLRTLLHVLIVQAEIPEMEQLLEIVRRKVRNKSAGER